eukprot:scaffold1491_cov110-Isochrysis_galbana.AAC.4
MNESRWLGEPLHEARRPAARLSIHRTQPRIAHIAADVFLHKFGQRLMVSVRRLRMSRRKDGSACGSESPATGER